MDYNEFLEKEKNTKIPIIKLIRGMFTMYFLFSIVSKILEFLYVLGI